MGHILKECNGCDNPRGCDICVILRKWIADHVDAVPVVRCKDCRASEPCVTARDGYLWCNAWDTVVRENGYCYHAEREGEDAD